MSKETIENALIRVKEAMNYRVQEVHDKYYLTLGVILGVLGGAVANVSFYGVQLNGKWYVIGYSIVVLVLFAIVPFIIYIQMKRDRKEYLELCNIAQLLEQVSKK